MKKIAFCAILTACCASFPAFATATYVTSPFAGNDSASWPGANGTILTASFSATSGAGNPISGTASGAGSEVCVVDAVSVCTWPDSGTATTGDFLSGDSIIWTQGNGPISLSFNADFDAGLWIQLTEPGTFTASIQAFNGITALGAGGTSPSDLNGDPVFIGVTDTVQEVTKITLSITACGTCTNMNDFAIDTLELLGPTPAIPEPSSWLLLASGILAIGLLGRRASQRNSSNMKHLPLIALLLFATASVPMAFGQDAGPVVLSPGTLLTPLPDPSSAITNANANPNAAINPVLTLPLPIWQYSAISNISGDAVGPYSISMVGKSPFNRGLTGTTVNVVLIPLLMNFNFGGTTGTYTFDPTASDDGCLGAGNTALSLTQASPMFNPIYNFTMNGVQTGTNTTYIDAWNRAQFWSLISRGGTAFTLGFNVTTAATQTINLTAGANASAVVASSNCGTNAGKTNAPGVLGLVNINSLDPTVLRLIISNLHLSPNQFPFFVMYDVGMTNGTATLQHCCFLGFHESETGLVANPGQTYGIAMFEGLNPTVFGDVADVSVMAHEMAEWVADPSGNNATPRWGNIGQVGPCTGSPIGGQTNLEVGDPLSGNSAPVAATDAAIPFTFHMQELAFFNWFYSSPSLGAGGKYSTNGTFSGTAKACPPGGTN